MKKPRAHTQACQDEIQHLKLQFMNVADTLNLSGVWSSHLIGLEAEIGSHRRSITEKEPGRLHQDFHRSQPLNYKTERTNTDVFARRRITCCAS
jgi:hypothetical protein